MFLPQNVCQVDSYQVCIERWLEGTWSILYTRIPILHTYFRDLRAGPAKRRIHVLKLVSRQPLQIRTWEDGSTDPGTIMHMRVQSVWESDSVSPRYPRNTRDIRETHKLYFVFGPKNLHDSNKIVVLEQGENDRLFSVNIPEDTRRRSVQLHCCSLPTLHPPST